MSDGPQSDLYAFLRRAWAQKRWLTLVLFVPFAVFALIVWNAVEKLSDSAGRSLGGTVESFITSAFRGSAPTTAYVPRSGSSPWLDVAMKEIGQKETPGPDNNGRVMEYIRAVRSTDGVQEDDVDWASAFVEWSLNQTGINGPKSMEPRNWLNWGRIIEMPERGCIVVFSFGDISHVGFYVGDDGASYVVLGGNQTDQVQISRFHKARALGFRMPP
jgi:uncharacterized protein (TIGR02594 family)